MHRLEHGLVFVNSLGYQVNNILRHPVGYIKPVGYRSYSDRLRLVRVEVGRDYKPVISRVQPVQVFFPQNLFTSLARPKTEICKGGGKLSFRPRCSSSAVSRMLVL